jgi:phosphoglycolate phosphatase-like HAD superfamily hydrolase
MNNSCYLIIAYCVIIFSCKSTVEKSGQSEEKVVSNSVAAVATVQLDSWADAPRIRIESWVKEATDSGSPKFIPVSDRIAVFDNDGTLWPEQPVPTQAIFAIDNLKAISADHPEFQKDTVLKGILNGDLGPMKKQGVKGLLKLISASHNGQSEEKFNLAVRNWIDTARDPGFNKLYKEVIYQPMLELLVYLRANGFRTFIVSGGGADFMRVWSDEVYGIPPYQVIGSYGDLKYEVIDEKPIITKLEGAVYVDDKEGKPLAIHRFIGKVPVFCGGNSDGDQAMMQYTHGSKYSSLNLIVHHTDSTREYKYDTKTLSGHLESALIEAKEKNWLVVDMANDWKKVFPFQ